MHHNKQHLKHKRDMEEQYVLPAEWERQSGIQLTWPHALTDWHDYLYAITNTYIHMAHAITQRELLLIATPYPHDVRSLLESELTSDEMANVRIFQAPTNDTWARDHAFITLTNGNDNMLVDFQFNGWGHKFKATFDNRINATLFFQGAFNGRLANNNEFVLEGGSIESDGKGTIFTTSQCLMAPHRNQPFSQELIEKHLKQTLHAQRIVWIDHGNLMGDDTDGHIDTIVRCAPNDTLVYVACDNPSDPQYDDFQQLHRQLKTLKTLQGHPYRLLPVPMPHAIYDGEDRLPATYANFVIINEAVLCPVYNQPYNDNIAISTLQKAFPGRDIIPIDATTVICQHGSLHCLTMQYPVNVIR